jgi:hypothetical protein
MVYRYRQASRQHFSAILTRQGYPAEYNPFDCLEVHNRIQENFEVSILPEDAMREISNGISASDT